MGKTSSKPVTQSGDAQVQIINNQNNHSETLDQH